jgi:hypothetical protein
MHCALSASDFCLAFSCRCFCLACCACCSCCALSFVAGFSSLASVACLPPPSLPCLVDACFAGASSRVTWPRCRSPRSLSCLVDACFAVALLPRHALLETCAPRLLPAVLLVTRSRLWCCSSVARYRLSRAGWPGCRSLASLLDGCLLRCCSPPLAAMPCLKLAALLVCCRLFFLSRGAGFGVAPRRLPEFLPLARAGLGVARLARFFAWWMLALLLFPSLAGWPGGCSPRLFPCLVDACFDVALPSRPALRGTCAPRLFFLSRGVQALVLLLAGCPSSFLSHGLAWASLALLASFLRLARAGLGVACVLPCLVDACFADAPLPRHALLGTCASRLLPAVLLVARCRLWCCSPRLLLLGVACFLACFPAWPMLVLLLLAIPCLEFAPLVCCRLFLWSRGVDFGVARLARCCFPSLHVVCPSVFLSRGLTCFLSRGVQALVLLLAGCPSSFLSHGLAWASLVLLASFLRLARAGLGVACVLPCLVDACFADAPLPRHALLGTCASRLLPAVLLVARCRLWCCSPRLLLLCFPARWLPECPPLSWPGCRSPRSLPCVLPWLVDASLLMLHFPRHALLGTSVPRLLPADPSCRSVQVWVLPTGCPSFVISRRLSECLLPALPGLGIARLACFLACFLAWWGFLC